MSEYTRDDLQEARAPITSLISKSEKAQQRLAPESWQYAMLRDNLKALRIASTLMEEDGGADFTREDLDVALGSLASMMRRTENTRTKFAPGTSQHTLQRNRLKALRVAGSVIEEKCRRLDDRQDG